MANGHRCRVFSDDIIKLYATSTFTVMKMLGQGHAIVQN